MSDAQHIPALLVSYYYIEPFLKERTAFKYRDWVLDSGAFSAHNSGVEIKLQSYIDFCKRIMEEDKTLTEVFALDVIGDPKASLKNTEEMWRQGVPAIPCYHANEPEDFLLAMAKDYPKIALGGVAMQKGEIKHDWAEQCFARIWPKKVHGFAFGSMNGIMTVPWHSVDSTNWEIGPLAFGRWERFGAMSVRGANQDVRCEVRCTLEVEEKARVRWRKEMLELGENGVPATLNVRLAWSIASAARASLLGLSNPMAAWRPSLTAEQKAEKKAAKQQQKPATVAAPTTKATAPCTLEQEKIRKTSAELDAAADYKFVDYWKNRGL